MSTSKIEIRNGKFVVVKELGYDNNGKYITEEALQTSVEENGWSCFVTHSGKIICECEREYSNGLNAIRFVIKPNGFTSLTYVDPSGRKEIRKQGFVIPKNRRGLPISGVLGLSGGNVTERYAYFRDAEFQAFLDRFGITAVKREDPNKCFSAPSIYCGGGDAYQKVWSDGQIDWDYKDAEWWRNASEEPGCNPNLYVGTSYHSVSNATWAVVETYCWYGNRRNYARILYTEVRDVTTLKDELTKHEVSSSLNR